jgi:hypothetical protein
VDDEWMDDNEFDAPADDLAPTGEIEYEESGCIDTAIEVDLLMSRTQAMRSWDG